MDEERKDVLLPPVDIDAEKAVLGSMLKNQDARADVSAMLRPDDFYLKEHQEIYRTMIDMDQRGTGIDITTVYSALKQRKTADMVGGITYLSRLMDEAIVPSNARYYAETVSDKSKMRQLITEAESIRDAAYSAELPPEDILDNAEQRILEIAHKSQRSSYVDINDVLFENIKQLQELEKNGNDKGIPTGFRDVDKILGGFQKTDLIILAARPGVGKTAWALNVAEHAASVGKKVMVFSLEMANTQLGERLLSMTSSVPLEHIHKGEISMEEWEDLSAAQDSFYGYDMVIDESSVITPDCAVILLSQLSRGPEQRGGDHMPKLSDLRDSGAIEQDADVVIFLKRDDYYRSEDERANIDESTGLTCAVNIAKHRNGPVGITNLTWIPRYVKFGNMARE